MSVEKVAIIGAGMTGLSCARVLKHAGLDPVIFDKGRGIGGRLATRRTPDGLRFDHGAQYFTARDDDFRALVAQSRAAGATQLWDDGSGRDHFVGTPGMSGIAKFLAQDLDVRLGAEVTGVTSDNVGWTVSVDSRTYHFKHLIITVPAPQALRLLGPDHPLAPVIDSVRISPCLTLMAAFSSDQPEPFRSRRDPEDPIAWIAQNSTKPGRPERACWVAQASTVWSVENLERDLHEIRDLMLPLLCERIGADPATIHHAAAHRWRYAKTAEPLERSFLHSDDRSLHIGGDWCLGARVEAAWSSGTAIAKDLLSAI